MVSLDICLSGIYDVNKFINTSSVFSSMNGVQQPEKFPSGFFWGTAVSAHQVDGGNMYNNWWEWEQVEGRIDQNDRSGDACDQWSRYEEDFSLLSQLNQNSYRFSMEWSRIFPKKGELDKLVIEHYHQFLDALKKRKIEPFVTLHHFTEPQWLNRLGGIERRQNLPYFKDFVNLVAREYSEDIIYWNTVNEPNIRAALGFFLGVHPPGKTGVYNYLKALRNLLRMHAEAYYILKTENSQNLVGVVKNINLFEPYNSQSRIDRMIAWVLDEGMNSNTLRGIRTGKLPLSVVREYKNLQGSSDFLGLNYYNRNFCSRKFEGFFKNHSDDADPTKLCTGLNWEAYPEGLYLSIKRLWEEFKLPIYITENGIGTTDDNWRKEFLVNHLVQIQKASREGIPIKGYFHWTLLDNFEWAEGYASKFGIIECDRKTLKRKIKGSGHLYARIAKENRLPMKNKDD
ncbi:MAG: glycoside hydrolase family 1 protein [Candidatus Hodarchaeales archaeon]